MLGSGVNPGGRTGERAWGTEAVPRREGPSGAGVGAQPAGVGAEPAGAADRRARPLPSALLPPPSLSPGARVSVCGAAARKCRRCAVQHPGRRQHAHPPARPPRSRRGPEQAPSAGPGWQLHWPQRVPVPAAPRPSPPCSWLRRLGWRCWSPPPGSPRFAAPETREGLWLPGSLGGPAPAASQGAWAFPLPAPAPTAPWRPQLCISGFSALPQPAAPSAFPVIEAASC